jgi:hypothetical protein
MDLESGQQDRWCQPFESKDGSACQTLSAAHLPAFYQAGIPLTAN